MLLGKWIQARKDTYLVSVIQKILKISIYWKYPLHFSLRNTASEQKILKIKNKTKD